MHKTVEFIIEAIKHVNNGMPKSSPGLIEERLLICESCSHYENKKCKKCGCLCSSSSNIFNKIAWADQHCPIDKW